MAYLPFMNPFDWISVFNLLSKKPEKHEPLIKHLKRIIVSYIYEVLKLDLEVATRLNSKPLYKIHDPPSGFSHRKTGKIDNKHWNVVFSSREGGTVLRKVFYLVDKHLYRTTALEHILCIVNQKSASNSVGDKKCFTDMLEWHLAFRKRLLLTMPKVFEVADSKPKTEEPIRVVLTHTGRVECDMGKQWLHTGRVKQTSRAVEVSGANGVKSGKKTLCDMIQRGHRMKESVLEVSATEYRVEEMTAPTSWVMLAVVAPGSDRGTILDDNFLYYLEHMSVQLYYLSCKRENAWWEKRVGADERKEREWKESQGSKKEGGGSKIKKKAKSLKA
ncbi:hypothetical protein L2E82_44979 [Cichorium intybus]|uniref:Uncharacterized protein n=1 Tax=Cichorium intybus TaxID=13427 RepID=A0ACB8ZT27_CICIN|nr:hypothetical protein L2E82_44979 [Cichorium intybus]